MALSLVEGMSEAWAPEQYHDSYREDVLALVKKKIKAKQTRTITPPSPEPEEERGSNVIDLVALLQQSLGKKAPAKAPAAAPRKSASTAKTTRKATPATPRKAAAPRRKAA